MALRKVKYFWNQVPLFRLIWPFVGGVILAIFYPNFPYLYAGIIVAAAVALCYALIRSARKYSGVLLMAAMLCLGYVHTTLLTDRLFEHHYSKQDFTTAIKTFVGEVVSDPIKREKSVKLEVELHLMVDSGEAVATNGKMLIYLQNDSLSEALKHGDLVLFNARLNPISAPMNPSEFNYQRYMHFHQISHQAYVRSDAWKLVNRGAGIIRIAHDAQKAIIDVLEHYGVTDRELAIVSALLVGYKHHLSSDQVSAFASAGAMHVLAVSGLHVGIIFLILNMLLKPLLKVRFGKIMKAILLLLLLWSYAAITGLSPSVSRACTMFSFVIVGQVIYRHTSIFNTIATSAVFLLIINPFYIVEVGFQLSYLAVLGIVLLQPRIYELWKPKYWLVEKIWAITAVSIAAQLATFPLGLLYFHQFPNYFLLSNLVVIPAATVILSVGIALVFLQWVPLLSSFLGYVLYWLVHGLDLFIAWVEGLPLALIQGIDIGIGDTYLIYLLIVALTLFIISKRHTWLAVSLALFCAIEGVNILETITQRKQSKMIIYSVRGAEAVDFIVGVDHVFLADSSLLNDFDKMRFHIHHHWWELDLEEPKKVLPELIRSESMAIFNDQKVIFLADSAHVTRAIESDHLVIQTRTLQHPKTILDSVKTGSVVLSQNLDWSTRSYWQDALEERGISYWDMKDKGAFVIE